MLKENCTRRKHIAFCQALCDNSAHEPPLKAPV
jgi:hypothetical protein